MQTQFHNGVNPWAGLHVPSTRKEAKEQRLKGWTKPPQAEDKIPTRTKRPRKLDNQPRGDKVGTSILKPSQVREIAEMIAEADRLRERLNELTHKAIAARFGVGESAVYAIKRGLSWSSITGIKGGKQ